MDEIMTNEDTFLHERGTNRFQSWRGGTGNGWDG